MRSRRVGSFCSFWFILAAGRLFIMVWALGVERRGESKMNHVWSRSQNKLFSWYGQYTLAGDDMVDQMFTKIQDLNIEKETLQF